MAQFKKILRTVSILLVIVGVMVCAVSCDMIKDVLPGILGGHTHNLTIVEKIEATCTENGQEAYFTCDGCDKLFADINGQTEIEAPKAIEALGHKIVGVAGTEATCTEAGVADCFKCSRCEKLYADAKGATEIEAPEAIEALGHSLTKTEAKSATCTEDGNNAYWSCATCNKVYADAEATTETTAAAQVIKAAGHALTKVDAKAPTCTEIGYDAYEKCSNCDYTTYAEKAALGHDEINHDAKAPTCTEIGHDAYVTCSRCDYTTYAEKVALGHDEINHDAKAPTCTEIGHDAYVTCSRCDYTTYAEKAALGHSLTKTEAKEATCLEAGNIEYWTCSTCGNIYSEEAAINVITETVIPAKGHSISETLAVEGAVTEYEPGSDFDASTLVVKLTCSACDYTKVVTDYSLSKTENLQPSDNVIVVTYVEDGKTYTASISILVVHVHSTGDLIPSVAPTCTEDGSIEYYECTVCKHKFADKEATELLESVVVPALGHDEINHEAKAPTCTETGYDAYVTCSRCDYTTFEEKAALGHSTSIVEAKAPTCTEDGYHAYYTCGGCDLLFSDAEAKNIIDAPVVDAALGHDEINHDAKAPTCTEAGHDAYVTCSRCDYTTFEEKAALGHSLTKTEAVAPTCTAEGNNAYWTCSVCNNVYADEEGTVETTVETETLPLAKHDTELKSDAEGHWYDCKNCDYVTDKENHTGFAYPDAAPECDTCGTVFGKASWDGWVLFRPGVVEVTNGLVNSASHVDVNGIMASKYVFGAHTAGAESTIWTMSDKNAYKEGQYQVRIPTVGSNERYIYLYVSNNGDTAVSFRIYSENYGDKGGVDVTLGAGESGWFKYSVHTGTTVGSNVNLKLLSDLESETSVTIYGYFYLAEDEIANLDIANKSDIKLSYKEGEKFNLPALLLTSNIFVNAEGGLLSDGPVEPYFIASNYTVSGLVDGQVLTAGTYIVTVSFGGHTIELEVTVSSHEHNIVYVPYTAATCDKDGNFAHYICSVDGCGQLFADAEGNTPIHAEDVVIAKGHTTAQLPGTAEYCTRCGKILGDEVMSGEHWVLFRPEISVGSGSFAGWHAEYTNVDGVYGSMFTFGAGVNAGDRISLTMWNEQGNFQTIIPNGLDAAVANRTVIMYYHNYGTEPITLKFENDSNSSIYNEVTIPAGGVVVSSFEHPKSGGGSNWFYLQVQNDIQTDVTVGVYGYFYLENEFDSISIIKNASKLNFVEGDTFSAEGLMLKTSGGIKTTFVETGYTTNLDGVVFDKAGTYTVEVYFGGKTVTYEIEVAAHKHQLEQVAGKDAVKCTDDGYESYYRCTVAGCGELFSDAEGNNKISAPVVIFAHTACATIPGQEIICSECGKATGNILDPDGWIHFAPGVVWSDYYEAIEGTVDGSGYIEYEIENYEGNILATKFTFAAGTPANAATAFWNDQDLAHNIKVPVRDGGTRVIAVITNHGTEDIIITIGQVDNARDTGSGTVLVPAGKSAVVEYVVHSGADLGNNGWIAVRNDVATETVVTMYGYFCAEKDAQGLTIKTPATNTTFKVGDTFSAEGLRLKLSPDKAASGAYYGQTEVYSNYTTNLDGVTFTEAGEYTVEVYFAGAKTEYTITVTE